jgi:uncharacterized integral membrane protein (TIGR00698 family)
MTVLGRAFKLKPMLITLLALGSSICGISAIIATQGAIDADEEDSSYAIAAILALGAISLFTFPLIGHWLHLTDRGYGLWAGLAVVDNTAEASAAGALLSDAAGRVAVLAKTCRNAMIGFVVLGYALYWASKGEAAKVENKAAFLWSKFPKFILGFLLISLLASIGFWRSRRSPQLVTVSLGLSANLCRRRLENQSAGARQARRAAICCRGHWRDRHCCPYSRPHLRCNTRDRTLVQESCEPRSSLEV